MKKKEFKIRVTPEMGKTNADIEKVQGELVCIEEGIKTFVHRAFDTRRWSISELTTGLNIVSYCKTRKMAIQEATKRLSEHKEHALKAIKKVIEKEGVLNTL